MIYFYFVHFPLQVQLPFFLFLSIVYRALRPHHYGYAPLPSLKRLPYPHATGLKTTYSFVSYSFAASLYNPPYSLTSSLFPTTC